MSQNLLKIWLELWRRTAPSARLRPVNIVIRPAASIAPMGLLKKWRPDWKTEAITAVLQHRHGGFVDVGANVGQTLADFLCAPVRSFYLGFEPNLICCQHLTGLISANGLDRCQVIPAALGNHNGVGELFRGGDSDPGASTRRDLRPRLAFQPVAACVYRFDDLQGVLPEPQVALVKIDVEGSELEVLRGMESTIRELRPWIICEVLHRDSSADHETYRQRCAELMGLIRSLGYEVQRIVQDATGMRVHDLHAIAEFPDVEWNEFSSTECDYLFLPASDVGSARRLLVR